MKWSLGGLRTLEAVKNGGISLHSMCNAQSQEDSKGGIRVFRLLQKYYLNLNCGGKLVP